MQHVLLAAPSRTNRLSLLHNSTPPTADMRNTPWRCLNAVDNWYNLSLESGVNNRHINSTVCYVNRFHPAFHSIHNRTHSSGKSIHQGFPSPPLHHFTDIDQMKLPASFACWRIDAHITFITAHPRMIINAPFTDVLRRRMIVT